MLWESHDKLGEIMYKRDDKNFKARLAAIADRQHQAAEMNIEQVSIDIGTGLGRALPPPPGWLVYVLFGITIVILAIALSCH